MQNEKTIESYVQEAVSLLGQAAWDSFSEEIVNQMFKLLLPLLQKQVDVWTLRCRRQ